MKMAKMKKIDIEEGKPHEVSELICLNCHRRAIHVFPADTLLKDLECICGATGLLIKTGQTLQEETICTECKLWFENRCKINLKPDGDYCGWYKEIEDETN